MMSLPRPEARKGREAGRISREKLSARQTPASPRKSGEPDLASYQATKHTAAANAEAAVDAIDESNGSSAVAESLAATGSDLHVSKVPERARGGSNTRPTDSKSVALSN